VKLLPAIQLNGNEAQFRLKIFVAHRNDF
jgi:hypothetical protein